MGKGSSTQKTWTFTEDPDFPARPAPPRLPAHLSMCCVTKISPAILPDKIMSPVTALVPNRGIIPKGQGARRARKGSRHLESEISTALIIFFSTKIIVKNEILQWYCHEPVSFSCIVYPGALLQHTLFRLLCKTRL